MKTLLKLTVFAFSILSIYTTKAAAITSAAQCAAYSQAQHWPMQWINGQCAPVIASEDQCYIYSQTQPVSMEWINGQCVSTGNRISIAAYGKGVGPEIYDPQRRWTIV